MRKFFAVAAVALVLAACSSSSNSTAPTTTAATSTSSTTSPSGDWTTYHHDAARSGISDDQAPIGQVRKLWDATLDGDAYAQPLVVGGHVIAATEANSVYAFDASSGAQVWRAQLGKPVDGGTLPCGNINPSGITGTPAADPQSNTLFVVAFLAAGTHHELFALDLGNGAVRWHRPIDPPGLSGRVEQERGALTITDGRVYVPYGGLLGDCGPYKGAVVSSALDGQGDLQSYTVPTRREAGIWHPGGAAADSSGLFVSTGNSESDGRFDFGNAVVHLDHQLQAIDYFAPTNWLRLNEGDTDLGSIGPALVGTNRVLATGKEGVAYLLDRAHLGNIGGSIASVQACGSAGAFGTAAVQGSTVFVPCTDGLVAVETHGDKAVRTWRRPGRAGPPIIAGGLVWDLDGSGTLVALDPATGQQRFSTRVGDPASRFVSMSAAAGRLLVAPSDKLTAFALR